MMPKLLLAYFSFGLGVWVCASVLRRKTFENASHKAIIKGLLTCVLVPPIALWLLDSIAVEENNNDKS